MIVTPRAATAASGGGVPNGSAFVGERPPAAPVGGLPVRILQRRLTVIWTLLFFNVLTPRPGSPSIIDISKPVGQLLTTGCLVAALVLAMGLNRRMAIRPNLVLGLTTILAALALMTSVRGLVGMGSLIRCGRLFGFLAVLWLLTPWWGRRDMLLARAHFRAVLFVCGTVLLGLVVAPGTALSGGEQHRLVGVVWAIPAPQVAEYAALAAGMAAALWAAGRMRFRAAAALFGLGVAMILASKTRTALVALVVAVAFVAISMFCSKRRVRRAVAIVLVAAPLAVVVIAPLAADWFRRDQSEADIGSLTGRRKVWNALLDTPRPEFNRWFGFGLSDKSFGGLSVDSTWLTVYQDEGLVGVALVGATVVAVIAAAVLYPPGPQRAVALFLVAYGTAAAYTEVGLGDASPYLLSLVAAASLVMPRAVICRASG